MTRLARIADTVVDLDLIQCGMWDQDGSELIYVLRLSETDRILYRGPNAPQAELDLLAAIGAAKAEKGRAE